MEHYFSRKGIMGIPLSAWDKSGMFFSVLIMMTGLLGAGALYNEGSGLGESFGMLLLGGLFGMGLILLHIMGDTKEAKRQIVAALTDAFANGTVHRGKEEGQAFKNVLPTKEEVAALSEAAVTAEEKLILEEVLEEYFWD